MAQKDWDKQIADMTARIKKNPRDVEAYNDRGIAYRKKGAFDKAIADYTKAVDLQPDYARAYKNRGNVYEVKGEFDRAIANHTKAIELNPDDAYAYNNRGTAYYQKGAFDEAIADYDKAIELNPDSAGFYSNRGTAYHQKGAFDEAITDFDKVIELNPDDAGVYYNRGVVYGKKGEHDKAIADFDKVIELKPDFADAYNNRGIVYVDKGNLDKAIADFDKAIKLQPELTAVHHNRALALAKRQTQEQIKEFQQKAKEQQEEQKKAYEDALVQNKKLQRQIEAIEQEGKKQQTKADEIGESIQITLIPEGNVELEKFANFISALNRDYRRWLISRGENPDKEELKLYIHKIESGSLKVWFARMAKNIPDSLGDYFVSLFVERIGGLLKKPEDARKLAKPDAKNLSDILSNNERSKIKISFADKISLADKISFADKISLIDNSKTIIINLGGEPPERVTEELELRATSDESHIRDTAIKFVPFGVDENAKIIVDEVDSGKAYEAVMEDKIKKSLISREHNNLYNRKYRADIEVRRNEDGDIQLYIIDKINYE